MSDRVFFRKFKKILNFRNNKMKEKFENLIYKIRKNKTFHNISGKWQNIHTIMLFFLFCFSALIWKLFSYTVIEYDFYN